VLAIKLSNLLPSETIEEMNEKERKILEAAIEIFAEKGFFNSSTSEIAKKASVAEGTIFRYFKTKKDLLLSILKPTILKVIAPFEIDKFAKAVFHLEHKTFEDFLHAIIKNRLEMVKHMSPVFKIVVQELPFQEDVREQFKALFKEKLHPKISAVIEHFQEKGQICDMPTNTIIRLIITNVIGVVISSLIIGNSTASWNEEEEIQRTVKFIMNGLSPQ